MFHIKKFIAYLYVNRYNHSKSNVHFNRTLHNYSNLHSILTVRGYTVEIFVQCVKNNLRQFFIMRVNWQIDIDLHFVPFTNYNYIVARAKYLNLPETNVL